MRHRSSVDRHACRTAAAELCTALGAPAGGGGGVSGWSIEPTPNPGATLNSLASVHAISSGDVWAVGYHFTNAGGIGPRCLALHWNGAAWSQVPVPALHNGPHGLADVHGAGAHDLWAVGGHVQNGVPRTLAMHWDGSAWNVISTPDPDAYQNSLAAVFAVSPDDVWAVGSQGNWTINGQSPLAMHWDGEHWQVVDTPSNPQDLVEGLGGLSALGPQDVWAVGSSGYPDLYENLAMRWDGRSWLTVEVPDPGPQNDGLAGVVALSPSNIWMAGTTEFTLAGQRGFVLHYDGLAWSTHIFDCFLGSNGVCFLRDIAANGPGDVLVTGERDLGGPVFPEAFRYDGVGWNYLDLEQLEGPNTGTTRGCALLPGGEAWSVGVRYVGGIQQYLTRAYHSVPPPPPGDIDGDGAVGILDFLALLSAWGRCAGCPADLDGDGDVGIVDLLMLLANWTG